MLNTFGLGASLVVTVGDICTSDLEVEVTDTTEVIEIEVVDQLETIEIELIC